jgi:hypothetical protein
MYIIYGFLLAIQFNRIQIKIKIINKYYKLKHKKIKVYYIYLKIKSRANN